MMNERLKQLIMSKLDKLGFRYDNDATVKVKKVAINFADSVAGAEVVTAFVFPDKCKVLNVDLDIVTKEGDANTKTIIVGNETDANGFIVGANVADVGFPRITLASAGQTLGTLLHVDEDGTGTLVPEADTSSGGEALCWTPAGADFAQLDGFIWVTYIDLT